MVKNKKYDIEPLKNDFFFQKIEKAINSSFKNPNLKKIKNSLSLPYLPLSLFSLPFNKPSQARPRCNQPRPSTAQPSQPRPSLWVSSSLAIAATSGR